MSAPAQTKQRTNVTIDLDTIEKARALNINLSAAAEAGLRAAIAEVEAKQWREENREAFESHRRWIEKNGIPLEKYRRF